MGKISPNERDLEKTQKPNYVKPKTAKLTIKSQHTNAVKNQIRPSKRAKPIATSYQRERPTEQSCVLHHTKRHTQTQE
jgi:methylphosphotriester-DNA--protein-cysteine methyltransferase